MTVVVHVWGEPAARTAAEAEDLLDSEAINAGPGCAAFTTFAERLRQRYPDANMLEADGRSGDASVWADSPFASAGVEPLFTVGLVMTNTDDSFWPFFLHTAASSGLHIYDPQCGTLYRPDRTVCDVFGREEPFPEAPDDAPPPPLPPLSDWQMLSIALERIHKDLAGDGWAEPQFRGHWTGVLSRQQGDVLQHIEIAIAKHDCDSCSYSILFAFSSDELLRRLCELLPEAAAELEDIRRNAHRQGSSDLRDGLYEIFGPKAQEELGLTQGLAIVHSADEARAWADRFCRWYRRIAILLDSSDRPETLNRLMHSKWRRSRELLNKIPHALLYELVLLDAGWPAPSADFDEWIPVVRKRCEHESGQALTLTDAETRTATEDTRWRRETGLRVMRLIERIAARRSAQ